LGRFIVQVEELRLHDLIRHVFRFFAHLGGFGLLGLGVLDSSILFMPLGNDLLVIILTARKPGLFWYYAMMATIGSLIGCALTDALSRKLGESGLERMVPKHKLERVQRRMQKHAWWLLGLASLMPPPFPFTVFLMAASALQYSRPKLFTAIGVGRMVRFVALAGLAVAFGRHILRLMRTSAVEYFVIGLAVISIIGSVFSILKWVRSGRGRRQPQAATT